MGEVPLYDPQASQVMREPCGSRQLSTICRKVNFRPCVEELRAAQFFFLIAETTDVIIDDIVGTDPKPPSCFEVLGSGFRDQTRRDYRGTSPIGKRLPP